MRATVFVWACLACLACNVHSRRVDAKAAFNPSSAGGRSPTSVPARASQQPKMAASTFKIPFLPQRDYLDGYYAGDWGFDPLGLAVMDGPWWKIAGMTPDDRRVTWMREAEVKHARLAMLAVVGWPMSELLHSILAGTLGLPDELSPTNGRAPSVLNGNLQEATPILIFTLLFSTFLELRTLDQVYGLTAIGITTDESGDVVEKTYVPGDLKFDPFGLYDVSTKLALDASPLLKERIKSDPELLDSIINENRRGQEAAEIWNGRLAMLGITGFALQEAILGTSVIDQTPQLFVPFFLLPPDL